MEKFLIKKPKSTTVEQPSGSVDVNQNENYKRKFRAEWLQSFDWLQNKDGSAFCVACEKAIDNHNAHLKVHEKTATHIRNCESRKKQHTLEMFYDPEQEKQHITVRNAEFALVMFCITHNLPFLIMEYLPALLVECCPDSSIAKLIKCGRTKSTQIAEIIGKKANDRVFETLRNTKFSLIADETTDISTTKSLVLVARFVDSARVVQDRFLALLEVTKSDAVSIFQLIKQFFNTNNIPLKNIIGLATDGANVMAGDAGGVKALLNKETNFFFMTCTCHSLHLCTSYASRHLPKSIDFLCRNIYNYFSHSSKRINDLKEFQEYCSVEPHKILGVSQTRWLSLEGVVARLIEQWDSLKLYFISCFYEVNGIRPAQLAEEMCANTKCYFLFLTYILPIINNLNKDFQSESSRLPYLYSNMKSIYLLIINNFVKHDVCIKETNIDFRSESNQKPLRDIFVGTKAEIFMTKHLSEDDIIEVKRNILSFYVELLNQINNRFDFNREDIKMLQIITPAKVLSQEDLQILPLILTFSELVDCDPDQITSQWNLLRLSDVNLSADMDIDTFWSKLCRG
ncbi:zinc finger protein 862-like [Anastrepha obliqua]|uniref:zinc finger protein 862-like n=1 Tax=Anastrepha obliqua TaxID=95512 RepID=UPI0024090A4E|nr:zinc finger protein 862-like [Anastrepha obliqua]